MQRLFHAGLLVLAFASTSAQAHVLDKKDDADAFKLRAAIAKQHSLYGSCLLKAVAKCEAHGVTSAPECDVVAGTVAYEPVAGEATAKFQDAVAKCDTKHDLDKKSDDYVGVGCPGDCDAAAGTQRCATLADYEASVETGVKAHVSQLQSDVDDACAGAGTPDSEARIDCVDDTTTILRKYRQALLTCQQKCEADLKGTLGGGALTNADVCAIGGGTQKFVDCTNKATAKLEGISNTVAPSIVSAANALIADLYNREAAGDPASPAGTLSPCGTCGDGSREGTEACDGMGALGACEACAADCTCTPAVCGNGMIEGTEVCDGAALGICTTSCAGDCTCVPPPVCGNGVIEGSEVCDGAALGTCTTSCAGDCTCVPPPVCGNDVIEGSEVCDGAALGTCTTSCAGDCTCIPDPDDPILDGPAGTFCSSTFNPSTTDYQPLCVPTAGSGHHFRIEGAHILANNGFFYLALGFPASPTGNPATTVGDGRFIFTGGKSVSCAFGWSYFRYSGITDPSAATLCTSEIFGDYPDGPQEICLDVSGDNPPRVTFWATGQAGADCKDKHTLTAASALYTKADWASADNQPLSTTTHFVKVNNATFATLSGVGVSSRLVLP